MAPNHGLVHPKEYDIKDSNVELIGSEIDHRVKYNSAATEPAWNDGHVGQEAGLRVWRIEEFEVVPWPESKHGQFMDGDSYIVLHSYKLGSQTDQDGRQKLGHDVFFWLGAHTTQDEAGTAAYKTVELDEFLRGAAAQHREVQAAPSDEFLELFPRLQIRRGGVRSGFRHVEEEDAGAKEEGRQMLTLLRIFKNPSAGGDGVVVHEVEPRWTSLDEGDVFVLDAGDKIWQWQGRGCSPMEKAKAAQVVNDMTLAKHVDVEVLAQEESRSKVVVDLLGGEEDEAPAGGFTCPRPVRVGRKADKGQRVQKLFRLSDASGELRFDVVKDGAAAAMEDFDTKDVFLLDDAGRAVWVWEGLGASRGERANWLRVAQEYVRRLEGADDEAEEERFLTPLAKVVEGNESRAFLKAVQA
ncbi:Severin [Colletotrichum sidae]|uniref:Severin n=1 Tax=Colletotrichum sidae TaxID=1347389 RepID=A0A4R8T5F6_9PEZI|nr:Severin [Colletotrichum sidae]